MNSKETILIVDDTLTNIDILVNLLDKYEIVVATSGQEALAILEEQQQIDLILLDIMMPNMDGFEVCRILKKDQQYKSIPIIFLTAKFDDVSIQEGFEIGAVDYIIKPFRPIELLSRIKTHLKILSHEKKLIEHNKDIAIGELLQNIAHQWRQPLSVISTASSAIAIQKEFNMLDDSELFDYCNKINENTQYLSKIIDNVSSILTDKNELTQINIKDFFDENHILFFGDTVENEITVELSIEDNLYIKGNRNKFIEVILALINNSKEVVSTIKDSEKLIFVDIKKQFNKCMLEIYDNAHGISSEILSRVFEPYFTTKHKSQGKGLSLYLVKRNIEELFKGTINISNIDFIYNQNKQKGAYIEITLPLV